MSTDDFLAQSDAYEDVSQAQGDVQPFAENIGRRTFMKMSGLAGGGLALAFYFGPSRATAQTSGPVVLNAFVRIAPDNTVLIYSKNPEIGQGIKTAFGLIIAEELDADWEKVKVEQAPVDLKVYGSQAAIGSNGIPRAWDQLRQAGAVARAMLITAAANQWSVPVDECTAADSVITHRPSGHTLTYGAVSTAAATLPVSDVEAVPLKARANYKLLGKRFTGVDNMDVVTGRPLFGIDVRLPDMLYASFTKCPAVGGKVISFNRDAIMMMPGVKDAFALEGNGKVQEVMPGVAVIATSTWAAFKAQAALQIVWDESSASRDSSTAMAAKAREIAAQGAGPEVVINKGDVDAVYETAPKKHAAFYEYPLLSHAPLEPQNATAWWRDGVMELWNPTQWPDRVLPQMAAMLGVTDDKIIMHQMRVGGGFGRRNISDFAMEAAAIALKVKVPVKLQWTREDDFSHDHFRSPGFHSLKAALDDRGKLVAWDNHLITFTEDGETPVIGGNIGAEEFPLNVLQVVRQTQTLMPLKIPCGWWRAPRSNGIAFAVQGFLHELAVAAGRDHLEFLLELMGDRRWLKEGDYGAMNTGRAIDVIKLAAEKGGWGTAQPEGRGLGLAFHFSHSGHFAEVIDLTVDAEKKITVHQITIAGDVGPIVNMSGAENQCVGAALDGLSTALGLEITVENGRIQQTNFNQYNLLRMRGAPKVVTHLLQPDFRPTGISEPALPPIAAALTNAIFAATGERVRSLPLSKSGYTI